MENIIFTLDNGNTIEQLTRDRTTYLGGSDVAAILGLSKYKSALDVYNAKVNGITQAVNLAMKVGLHCEEIIVDSYKEGLDNIKFAFHNVNAYSGQYSFIGAQLDLLIVTMTDSITLADIKVKGQMMQSQFGEEYTSDIPEDIYCQVALQRYLTGAEYVDIPVLFFPTTYKVYRYTKNERFEEHIIEMLNRFWHDCILAKNPPKPMSKEDLDFLYPTSNGLAIEVNYEFVEQAERLKGLKGKMGALKKQSDALELELKKTIGANEIAIYGGEKVASCATVNRKAYTVSETTYRTLRLA